MLSSFFSGISGLVSNSQSINVVGNNIANVNTIGYKASRATFEDVLYQSIFGTSGTSQVGRGSALASVDTLFSQGSFESTSEPTDLAIGGKGFFIVKSQENGTNYFTRAGQFRFDKEGRMINPAGYVLQGKAIDRTTNSAFGIDTDIVISPEPSEPRKTGAVGMIVNLQSDAVTTGKVGAIDTGGITGVAVSTGKFPWSGDYTSTITNRDAAEITKTGSEAATFTGAGMTGSVRLNGVTVDVTGVADLDGLVDAINNAMVAAGMDVRASAGGTDGDSLTLTATANGTDIVFSDSSLESGSATGWSDDDKQSAALYGSTLALSVPEIQADGSVVIMTHTGVIGSNRGTAANWQSLGVDITTANTSDYVLTAGTQHFNISGFKYKDADLTSLVSPSTTSNYQSSITVYDSLGQPHNVTVYFRKLYEGMSGSSQSSKWEWNAMVSGTDWYYGEQTKETYHLVGKGYLDFNNNGVLTSGGDATTLTFNFSGADQGQKIDLIFGAGSGGGSTTQYPIASKTNYQGQDGYPPGVLQNVTVSQEGTISGHYSNGQILDLYKVTLADFNNQQGLKREGGNLFSATLESGTAFTNAPGEGGLGKINPNSLEQSNVDLATEFVKMIVAQRGFQANSRVITTTDEVLQELMNLKR